MDAHLARGYSLEVRTGRPAPDPRIPPDRFEPNDNCSDSDERAADPALALDLGQAPPVQLATIDHGFDLDWYRFTVPESDTALVTIKIQPLPLGAEDRSNLGVLLASLDDFDGESGWLGSGDFLGGGGLIVHRLAPGDYYALVWDRAEVATPYELCITVGVQCPDTSAARAHEPSP